jgi:hypothetical protein
MPSRDTSLSQSGSGPAKVRDERAIRHRIFAAVTEADNLLRDLWIREQAPDRFEGIDFAADIRRVRGLLAEWRLESD